MALIIINLMDCKWFYLIYIIGCSRELLLTYDMRIVCNMNTFSRMLFLKLYAYWPYIMKLQMIPFQYLSAFVGKFILFVCKRICKCCSSYFKVYSFNFSNHVKEHACETWRINYFIKAIICISAPAKDKVEGMKANNQQQEGRTWHDWKM